MTNGDALDPADEPWGDPDEDGTWGGDDGTSSDRDAEGWRDALEVLALLVLLGVVGTVGQALFTGLGYSEVVGTDPASPSRWTSIANFLVQGGSVITAGLVALALGLVLLAPGPVGRRGRWALQAIPPLGVVVATLAVLGIEEVLRNAGGGLGGFSDASGPGHADLYGKVAGVVAFVPAVAVAAFAAATAWRALAALTPRRALVDDLDGDEPYEIDLDRDDLER
ncbi:hypothetical protein KSP35_21880 [Aquihabitans sp. G128]|uniref:hypothetical protein n=1 Tax=Aquihabitans sp. G128 TaxID=2849779 RepID=UPI001C233320|nr:hypothetical protein [Aquihabitans sp. G128]QXC60932.1 hypothetical protein KSP35_21880 [Aquihabitans sp. G128]